MRWFHWPAQTKLEDAESKVQMLEELVQRLVLSQVRGSGQRGGPTGQDLGRWFTVRCDCCLRLPTVGQEAL